MWFTATTARRREEEEREREDMVEVDMPGSVDGRDSWSSRLTDWLAGGSESSGTTTAGMTTTAAAAAAASSLADLFPEAHADEGEGEEGGGEGEEGEGEGDGDGDGDDAEEEEEEEPEDILPPIQEACKQTAACKPHLHHFEECQERVSSGKGDHGENCAEELFHLMHCVDQCAAPKLFKKLK